MTMVEEPQTEDDDEMSYFEDEVLSGPVKTPGNATYQVPVPEEFGSYDFMAEADLEQLGQSLIQSASSLGHLRQRTVRFFWKKKGGAVGGKPQFGKCLKPSGLFWQLADEPDFIVWLAADHCAELTKHEVEGVLFRQLCHAGVDGEGNRVLVSPDVHEFRAVLERYGPLDAGTKAFVKTARQLTLQL